MPHIKRVVVTGMGMVSPLGCGLRSSWSKLLAGHSGASRLGPEFDELSASIAARVPRGVNAGELDMGKYRGGAKSANFIAFALEAAEEALTDARWNPTTEAGQCATGVAIGSGIGSIADTVEAAGKMAQKRGFRKISPYFVPRILVNLAGGHVSIQHSLKGPNHACATACATGAHAIGDAFRMVERGDADVMVCGGTESTIDTLSVAGFARAQALCTDSNDAPEKASRPFDESRSGFVIGEGAGVMVLESLDHALGRGVRAQDIYAEVCGYGMSGDAFHITAPREDGDGAARCMLAALRSAGLGPCDIDFVNAHATSTKIGDAVEIRALERVFGQRSSKEKEEHNKKCLTPNPNPNPTEAREAASRIRPVSVSSTKGHIGHLLGAAGAVEAIFTVQALRHGVLIPTLNLDNPLPTSPDIHLQQQLHETGAPLRAAMSNSFGFGGTNCSLIFKQFVG